MKKFTIPISKAVNLAGMLHEGQERKGDGLPYIIHPFVVALMLMDYSEDEEVIIAGILHDTIEDTEYTKEQMTTDFGQRVTDLVMSVTETHKDDPWQKRKDDYLAHLKNTSYEAKLICAADKLHNLQSMIAAIAKFGDKAEEKFNAPKDKKIWFYEECLNVIKEEKKIPIQLVKDYEAALDELKSRNEYIQLTESYLEGLRKASIESVDSDERYEKIYAIERMKWPHNMGSKTRDKIPKELHHELDQCIGKSQAIARNACQTEKLTKNYIMDKAQNNKLCNKCSSKNTKFINSTGGEDRNSDGKAKTDDWFLYECKDCQNRYWITKKAHKKN